MLIQSLTCSARRLYASCLNKNGSPTRGGVRVEDGRPIPVEKTKTKTKTKKRETKNKNGSPTRGGVRVEDGRPIPVKKIKTKTKTKKTGKQNKNGKSYPWGRMSYSQSKNTKSRKNNKNPLLVREGL